MFFFFNDTATTEIYTLSLHDALPILGELFRWQGCYGAFTLSERGVKKVRDYVLNQEAHHRDGTTHPLLERSEEHTSELQSRQYLVCRLLLEKKKKLW